MPPQAKPETAATAGEQGGMDEGELCLPVSFLAQPDDNEAMQTPAEGDTVSIQVDATVTRIEGDNAYIQPKAVNGNELKAQDEGTPDAESQDASEGSGLRQEAQQMDANEQQAS